MFNLSRSGSFYVREQGRCCLVKGVRVYDVQDSLAVTPCLAVVGGHDAVFLKLDQMIVHGSVSGADSLAYVSAAGSLRVQEQVAQHFGTQRIQSQD